jgi:hypothetical protein
MQFDFRQARFKDPHGFCNKEERGGADGMIDDER